MCSTLCGSSVRMFQPHFTRTISFSGLHTFMDYITSLIVETTSDFERYPKFCKFLFLTKKDNRLKNLRKFDVIFCPLRQLGNYIFCEKSKQDFSFNVPEIIHKFSLQSFFNCSFKYILGFYKWLLKGNSSTKHDRVSR